MYPDKTLHANAVRVKNEPFEEQMKLRKKLVESQDGEESDNESDVEEVATEKMVREVPK